MGGTYFLYGYYGAGNFGDDALLQAAVGNILRRDPGARFLVRNYGPVTVPPEAAGRITPTDIEEVHFSGRSRAVRFLALLKAYWVWTGRSTAVVVGGGTLIHDRPHLASTFLLLCLCLMARLRGRAVYGIGLGTKTMTSMPGKMMTWALLRLFTSVGLRDADSFGQCRAIHAGAKMRLTADLAYALPWDVAAAPGRVIAVSLVDYATGHGAGAFLRDLAAALDDYAARGYGIRLLSLQAPFPLLGVEGDHAVLERLCGMMRGEAEIVAVAATPESVKAAYDSVCLTVGMRFHSLVFSVMAGIPFAGLRHEPKIGTICAEFGMPCVDLKTATGAALGEVIGAGLQKEIDRGRLSLYQTRAQDNFSPWDR